MIERPKTPIKITPKSIVNADRSKTPTLEEINKKVFFFGYHLLEKINPET